MNDCSSNLKKFIAALSVWMIDFDPNKPNPPDMSDFGLCRNCAMRVFCQIAEMNMLYSQDIAEIIHETQDLAVEMQSRLDKARARGELKH